MICVGALISGCSQSPAPAAAPSEEPSNILVEPSRLLLTAGHAAWIAAQANDTAGQPIGGAIFRFTPSDSRILQVSQTGLVTALGPASDRAAVIVASGRQQQRVPVVVVPDAPQHLEKISGDDQHVQAGQAPAEPLVARVVDRWNNPIAGVHLTTESTAEGVPSTEVVTGAEGIARLQLPPLTRAGTVPVTVKAPVEQDLSAMFSLHVEAGLPAAIDRIPSSPSGNLSASDPAPIALRVTDAHGNPVPDVALIGRVSKADAAPLRSRTDTSGSATLFIPHRPKIRRINLDVETSGSPPLRRSFVFTFDPATTKRPNDSSAP